MREKILSALCLFMGVLGVAYAEPTVEIDGRYWMPNLTSSVKSTEAGLGSRTNLRSDLGVRKESLPDIRLSTGQGALRMAYNQVSLSGNRFVGQNIEFGGEIFTAGTRVKTDIEFNYLRLGWAWKFIDLFETGKIGPLLEIKSIWGRASLEAPELVSPVRESLRFALGIPTLGLAAEINPHEVIQIFAEVSGLPAGNIGYFLDAEGGIKIIPVTYLTIVGGYRIFDMKVERRSDFFKLRMDGPFVGATLRF